LIRTLLSARSVFTLSLNKLLLFKLVPVLEVDFGLFADDGVALTTLLLLLDTSERGVDVTEALDVGLTLVTSLELLLSVILLLEELLLPDADGALRTDDAEDGVLVVDGARTAGLLAGSTFLIMRELFEGLIVPEEEDRL